MRTRKRWHGVARCTGAAISNDTDFLARSRRKHDAATDKIKQSKPENTPCDIVSRTSAASLAPGENRLPLDPASLPTIEYIGAESDIRASSKPGWPTIWHVRRFVACGR